MNARKMATILVAILISITFIVIPQMLSIQNSENNSQKVYSISNSNSEYILNCSLPASVTNLQLITGYNIPITENQTKLLVKSLFGYEPIKIDKTAGDMYIDIPGGVVDIGSYTELIYKSTIMDVNRVGDLSAIQAVADEFKDKVVSSIPFEGYNLVYDKTFIGMSSIINGTRSVIYWQVRYKAVFNGAPIYGAGLGVGVSNGKVVSVISTLPIIETTKGDVKVITPNEALNKFGNGIFNGTIKDNSLLYVNKITLGYWYVPYDADNIENYQLKPIYCIEGTSVFGPYKDSFTIYILAD